jgi:4-hydroxybenzoate polyprenyltransferase
VEIGHEPVNSGAQVVPVSSLRFWRAFAITLRPYLMFLSLSAGLCGLALTQPGRFWPLYALAFFFSYGLGQAITDTFQTDTDALSSPYRPLVRGEVTRSQVLIMALLGMTACGIVIFYANPWTALPAVAGTVGLVSYTWFKRRWWGGPPWNAWIVAMLPLMGVLCGGSTPAAAMARTDVKLAVIGVFASYVPFVILGYLKDVSADTATGYQTIVIRFGARVAITVSLLHAVVGAIASSALVTKSTFSFGDQPALLLWGLGWVLLFVAHFRLWINPREETAYSGIVLSASGFVAIHLGEAALLRPGFQGLSMIAYAVSVWMLWRRPMRKQI